MKKIINNPIDFVDETLDGLIKHNGPILGDTKKLKKIKDIDKLKKKINMKKFPSLEAQISSISDNIAYNNHDIQDGVSAGVFSLNDLKFSEKYLNKKNIQNIKIQYFSSPE